MLLCLDVGNTQIHGGVFDGDALTCQFRKSTQPLGSTDELGVFFTAVLRESGVDPRAVDRVAICSVVPAAQYCLWGAALKYFGHAPFVLQAGVKTGLKVRYRNPLEVGADRIAGAIAAAQRHPARDLIVVDCGTATTLEVITAGGEYLGGAILPGVGVSAETLASHTAKLPRVEIARPSSVLGRTTVESIQSGLYHGHVGAIRHVIAGLDREVFSGAHPLVIGTGGFARMFEEEKLFDEIVPELVLWGLKQAEAMNREGAEKKMIAASPDVELEAERLFGALLHADCEPGRRWNYDDCLRIAPLTLEINRVKREKRAVILAHSYVEPEIIYGVADFKGDSYFLSEQAKKAEAEMIVFAGVVFMAETAKILSPRATVVVPDRGSGCSLADSLTGAGLRRLKSLYPDAAVVCYINSTADVKAESDVCVTSSNVHAIVARLPQRRILFVPDRLMAENVRAELRRSGIDKEVISSDGTCLVHDKFTVAQIAEARARYSGLKVVAHPECPAAVAAAADFVGSTGAMMRYVKSGAAPHYLMLTECGLVGRLQVEDPEKHLIGGCRLCPYMKLNSLEKVRDALVAPRPDQVVTLDENLRVRAERCIERMFELAPAN